MHQSQLFLRAIPIIFMKTIAKEVHRKQMETARCVIFVNASLHPPPSPARGHA